MKVHPFEPVYDENSEILILGSFPSVKSRENGFYYMHPQNRFWKVISAIYGSGYPETVEDKKKLLSDNRIALWDVVKSCDISGSSDSSIKNVKINDIEGIVKGSKIKKIIVNGRTAQKYFEKYAKCGMNAEYLPSTSPANNVFSLEKLIKIWKTELLKKNTL